MKNKWESIGFAAGILCLTVGAFLYSQFAQKPVSGGPSKDKTSPAKAREEASENDTSAVASQKPQKTAEQQTPSTAFEQAGDISFERRVSPASYTSGKFLDVALTFTHSGKDRVNALAVVENLPNGLVYSGITNGTRPVIEPAIGAGGQLAFVWVATPVFPFTFTYQVQALSFLKGTVQLHGQVVYRKGGPELRSKDVVTAVPSSAP